MVTKVGVSTAENGLRQVSVRSQCTDLTVFGLFRIALSKRRSEKKRKKNPQGLIWNEKEWNKQPAGPNGREAKSLNDGLEKDGPQP